MLVDKAPRKAYWIINLPEDGGLPLKLETSEMDSYYKVNGTFRNYAVNCPDEARNHLHRVQEWNSNTGKRQNHVLRI
ncbi:MAG: hypothetical protein WBV70_00130 [Candidatus Bathyarchaeia archaeon]